MKGHNQVWLGGNVGGKIVVGKTRDNDPACSFSVAAEDGTRGATWVRVNAYGALAVRCQKKAVKGIYVTVVGELMNREGKCGELTEVRAKEVVFFPHSGAAEGKEDMNEQGQEADGE
jgi:single-stranded DNA-binding protein